MAVHTVLSFPTIQEGVRLLNVKIRHGQAHATLDRCQG